jgi:hypothetical protein
MNIQGLCPQTVPTKVPFINDSLCSENQLFIGLSETWLQSHNDAELSIEGYTLFRCDSSRKKKNHGRLSGGVAMFLRDDIACSCEVLYSHAKDAVQLICLFSQNENLALITIYRRPDDKSHGHPSTPNDFMEALNKVKIKLAEIHPTPDIIMGGDFNLPHAIWPDGTPKQGATYSEKQMLNTLNEFSNDLCLSQMITSPTHKDGNILDLLLVNNTSLVHQYSIIPVLHSTSHHSIIQVSTMYKSSYDPESTERPKLRSFNALNFFNEGTDWATIYNKYSDIDWKHELADKSEDDILQFFYSTSLKICEEHVPVKSKAEQAKMSRTFRYRRSLTRKRRRINKRLTRSTSPYQKCKLNDKLLQIEKELQKSYQNSATYIENKAVEAIKTNPKFFYTYAKKKSKVKSKIGPLLNSANKLVGNSKEMAEILSEQYTKVFSTPIDPSTIVNNNNNPTQASASISDITFTESDMESAIDELRITSASGPDGFPAAVLKNCKQILAVPLTIFWRKCLDNGHIPNSLKQSVIVPQHKGDSRAVPANYRPIALTSHIIKIFEKILRKHIVNHMNTNNLFNPNQHGFRAGRSCLSQLLEHVDTLINILQDDSNADVVYLDFAKAFDKVDFSIVLNKISNLGINGKLYEWIKSFLTNRYQSVIVNGIKSDPQPMISGVPQGSVLGPLIFLILIGDIDKDIVKAFVKSFADDTRATNAIKSIEDTILLQEDLDRIYSWTDEANMKLNDIKFELVRYGDNDVIKTSTAYTTPSGDPIVEKTEVKDLGVIMSNDCRFDKQINSVIEKGKNTMSWILRTFKTRSITPMLTLYKSLPLPIIEYCSALWCPLGVGQIQKLEALQWSFIRKISNTKGLNYWECLKYTKLYSLQRRRERYRMIYVWKILEKLVPNINNSIISHNHIRHGRKCFIPVINASAKINKLREASLPIHGARLFNALPNAVRNLSNTSILKFKSAVDKFLRTVPDEPQIPGLTICRRASSNSIINMVALSTNSTVSSVTQITRGADGEVFYDLAS